MSVPGVSPLVLSVISSYVTNNRKHYEVIEQKNYYRQMGENVCNIT